ncbi:hypothetical protein ACP70R_037320 [Stipagrostis hirtigluma subsp. patula]
MDRLCDNVVEEILLRLPLKHLHRLRAVSRRYNAIVLGPGFAPRYWRSHGPHLSGVFLQGETLVRPWGAPPRFLPASGGRRPSMADSVLSSDLAFLRHVQTGFADGDSMIFVLHASSGLLLCSRGREMPAHYYVCNPVTWQWVALPELPWPGNYDSLLSVVSNGDGNIRSFQVILAPCIGEPCIRGPYHVDLKVFSSATGRWGEMRLRNSSYGVGLDALPPPVLGRSGIAYWISDYLMNQCVGYDSVSHSVCTFRLPACVAREAHSRCLGERHDGGLRYAHFDFPVFEVWDLMTGVDRGTWWKRVHRISVTELAERNPGVATLLRSTTGRSINGHVHNNSRFEAIGIHPTDDIVYFNVAKTAAAYSIGHSTIRFVRCPLYCFRAHIFSYVHPPHLVLIPEIRTPT